MNEANKPPTAAPLHGIVIGCMNCGLPLVPNHHPDAGKPEHINTVGCPSGCLPCTEKRANGRHKVIVGLRIWLEDELQKFPDDRKRRYVLDEVLAKLNQLEESRRVAYHASR
jgi:hypothetical protein